MGNCCRKKPKRRVVLLLVGLDNAGKTVTVKGLAGENSDNSVPTVGFSTISLNYRDMKITIFDLGGRSDIRGIWPRYFVDAHGVIFVIDSSDYKRLNEAKLVLHDLLSHEKISGKPVLLLANKQDYYNALDEIDIAEKLELENLVNTQKCPTLVESCSAMNKQSSKKIDPGIKTGYHWLINYISREYETLNERVQKDVDEQLKREREIRQQQLLKLQNESKETEIDVDVNKFKNPFKPIKELVTENNYLKILQRKDFDRSRPNSALSTHSTPQNVVKKKEIKIKERPKSAIEGVKRQLKKTNRRKTIFSRNSNKTVPTVLFTPKKANTQLHINKVFVIENGHSTIEQIEDALIITELPNIPIENNTNDNHIETMFTSNKFKPETPPTKLPPIIYKKSNDISWVKKPLKNKHFVQDDIDRIYKDIS